MTTIRRTLSPVPRPGTLLGGEATSAASPLSKCSSCTQDYASTTGSTEYVIYRFQTFLLNLFSKRTSRSLQKHKPRVIIWRRSLFIYCLFFVVGAFLGFTPTGLIKTSNNRVPKKQDFLFDQLRKVQLYDVSRVMSTNPSSITEANNFLFDSDRHMLHVKQENETINGVVTHPHIQGFGKLLIIVTTPTYPSIFQGYYLNRLAHILKLIEAPLLWVVVEMTSQSAETSELLRKSGVMYRHLVCTKNTSEIRDSRVHQRNVALSHIEKHRLDGIVYFAEDTNVYSIQLFDHMRQIRRFGTWPVAKLKKNTRVATIVGPVCNRTQVVGWHTNNVMRRFHRFHSDLSGFAFNSTILWDPVKWHRPTLQPIRQTDTVKYELQVSTFIEQVVEDETEMEGIPEDCSRVLVWHLPMELSSALSQQSSVHTNTDSIFPLSISI